MHILKGFRCKGCDLKSTRTKRVPGRGQWPAEVLFIGEAPGKTEDILGEAFVGPNGKLLQRGIQDAERMSGASAPSYYITNVVACRPCDAHAGPNREPTAEEALACWPRLKFTYDRVQPDFVVFLGKVAEKHCKRAWPNAVSLVHPAFVLRCGGTTSSAYRTFVRGLATVFKIAARKRSHG